jgi:hypothetical protein
MRWGWFRVGGLYMSHYLQNAVAELGCAMQQLQRQLCAPVIPPFRTTPTPLS